MSADARRIAARLLLEVETPGDFLEHRMEADSGFDGLPPVDRRFAQELIFGVIRWRRTLDWLISAAGASRSPPSGPRVLLQLGLYQLFWLDRIPPFAAVNETVRVARAMGFSQSAGFINAILRRADRDREALQIRLVELRTAQPDLGWSHPKALTDRWQSGLKPDELQRLLAWNNSPPPLWVRRNSLLCSADQLLETWKGEGVTFDTQPMGWLGDGLAFAIRSPNRLGDLASFQKGWFYVQDPSTLFAVSELAPLPGEAVLDLCAAPGGKTTFIAQKMGDQGEVTATDSSGDRLAMVTANCRRLNLGSVRVRNLAEMEADKTTFDRVLVDAPCSNTGVLRRRVEARWRFQEEEVRRLAEQQFLLMEFAAQRVRPGGRLVYSTCSLEPEENQGVTERFRISHPEFRLGGQRQLHPVHDQVDGAFVATWCREIRP